MKTSLPVSVAQFNQRTIAARDVPFVPAASDRVFAEAAHLA